MFLELEYNNEFRRAYFETLKYRMAFGSLELEGYNDDLAHINQSLKIYNQLQAINYMFENHKERDFSHYEFTSNLCEIVKRVSGDEISGFRTTDAMVVGSKVERTHPQYIRNSLWYLIDDYNYMLKNCKNEEDLYELEAIFHIKLLHIHPFDDGNGRTARILLAYNLCKHDLAPCVITKEIKKEYCDLIEKGDYKKLAKMFQKLSNNELKVMVSLYSDLNEKGLINEPTEQEKNLFV